MSETVTVWEAGEYVGTYWGHYSTARALTVALDLGWTPEDRETVQLLVEWQLSGVGPAPEPGGWRAGYVAGLESRAVALAEEEGWSLTEDLSEILRECVGEAEEWLTQQPQTPEGHYWGCFEGGGWGCWLEEGLRQCDGCGALEDAGEWPDQSPTGLSVCCAGEEEWL